MVTSPRVELVTDPVEWDTLVNALGGHPLQLWGWGQVKARGAWRAHRLRVVEGDRAIGAAQVLERRLLFPFRALSYVPRGPVVAPADPDGPVGHGVGDAATRAAVSAAVVQW
ncbi:MAG: GNAT family N-acetyltransferase, partial [Actinotalea sp.]|nr:GNAT family N-acetyltransferase [Actinotalea sp.]